MHDEILQLARSEMIERQLRRRGIRDPLVLDAMARIPREIFLSPALRPHAYDDAALPSLSGQTISQPYIVALMTEALDVAPHHRILELGTGTGYQTAILAHLAPQGEVCTIERIPALTTLAQSTLAQLHLPNICFLTADGTTGWPESCHHPETFDRILVTAGAPSIPHPLLRQLRDGGILVLPVGSREEQTLLRIQRQGDSFIESPLCECRFVPLLGQSAWQDPSSTHN